MSSLFGSMKPFEALLGNRSISTDEHKVHIDIGHNHIDLDKTLLDEIKNGVKHAESKSGIMYADGKGLHFDFEKMNENPAFAYYLGEFATSFMQLEGKDKAGAMVEFLSSRGTNLDVNQNVNGHV